jgi:hypothetical protein
MYSAQLLPQHFSSAESSSESSSLRNALREDLCSRPSRRSHDSLTALTLSPRRFSNPGHPAPLLLATMTRDDDMTSSSFSSSESSSLANALREDRCSRPCRDSDTSAAPTLSPKPFSDYPPSSLQAIETLRDDTTCSSDAGLAQFFPQQFSSSHTSSESSESLLEKALPWSRPFRGMSAAPVSAAFASSPPMSATSNLDSASESSSLASDFRGPRHSTVNPAAAPMLFPPKPSYSASPLAIMVRHDDRYLLDTYPPNVLALSAAQLSPQPLTGTNSSFESPKPFSNSGYSVSSSPATMTVTRRAEIQSSVGSLAQQFSGAGCSSLPLENVLQKGVALIPASRQSESLSSDGMISLQNRDKLLTHTMSDERSQASLHLRSTSTPPTRSVPPHIKGQRLGPRRINYKTMALLGDIFLEVQYNIVLKLITDDDNPDNKQFSAWCREDIVLTAGRHSRSRELTEGNCNLLLLCFDTDTRFSATLKRGIEAVSHIYHALLVSAYSNTFS